MAEREKEIVVTSDGASRGAIALAAVIAFVLLLILLAYVFRGELYGGDGGPADVKVNIQPG